MVRERWQLILQRDTWMCNTRHIYTKSQNDDELRCGFDGTVQSLSRRHEYKLSSSPRTRCCRRSLHTVLMLMRRVSRRINSEESLSGSIRGGILNNKPFLLLPLKVKYTD